MPSFSFHQRLMGSDFQFVLVDNDQASAQHFFQLAVDEVKRIENLLTEFSPGSQTSLINDYAGIRPVSVDEEVYQLIQRALQLSKLTQGAFDITIKPFKSIYKFDNDNFSMPSDESIASVKSLIGYEKIRLLENNSVFLPLKGMAISFAGIGKGYAADKVRDLWKNHGLKHAVVSASGDLCAMGLNDEGKPWRIGVAHPDNTSTNIAQVNISDAAVASSGNYEQFFIFNNKKYGHTINPITGKPCLSLKSVTVVSPSAELSDALATAVYVMGAEKGCFLINQLPATHTLIVDDFNTVHLSENSIFEYEE